MIFEARSSGVHAAATPQRKQSLEQGQRFMHRAGAGIRSVILRPILFHPSGGIYSGVFFTPGYFDERIGLVIPQTDVVARPMLLDQIAFENQRFYFGSGDNGFKRLDARNQRFRLRTQAPLLKIRANPVFEIDGFAHINDFAGNIPHQIYPGLIRQQSHLGVQLRQTALIFFITTHEIFRHSLAYRFRIHYSRQAFFSQLSVCSSVLSF